MPTRVSDLRNCFLVTFKASVHGGIRYRHSNETTTVVKRREESSWQTDKVINDKEEYSAAQALRAAVLRSLAKLGRVNELGAIVPVEKEKELDELIEQNRQKIREFNDQASFSNMRFSALKFYISGENEVVLEDMLDDLRDILDDLKTAIKNADYSSIRAIVTQLQGFEMVLPPSASDVLQRAVADARKQAREARKSLEKKGEELSAVQERMSVNTVDFARFAVMDPSETLDDVDNDLVKQMMSAQAATRTAGLVLVPDEDSEDSAPFSNESPARQVML